MRAWSELLSEQTPFAVVEVRSPASCAIELVVLVLAADNASVHVFSARTAFPTCTLSMREYEAIECRLASLEDARFPPHPMVVARDLRVAREFLRCAGLDEGTPPSMDVTAIITTHRSKRKQTHACTMFRLLRDSDGEFDGSMVWWSGGRFTFVAGGVTGSVQAKQTVMWDEKRQTTRRDRNGRASVFCDPSPAGRSARRGWTTSWPRIVCVLDLCVNENAVDPAPHSLPATRLTSFVAKRKAQLVKWLESDKAFEASPSAEEERRALAVVDEARAALVMLERTPDRAVWTANHDRLVHEFKSDSSLIRRLEHKVQQQRSVVASEVAAEMDLSLAEAAAVATNVAHRRVSSEEDLRDDLSLWHTKPDKAAINTQRRAVIRLYRRFARDKRWFHY